MSGLKCEFQYRLKIDFSLCIIPGTQNYGSCGKVGDKPEQEHKTIILKLRNV